MHVKLARDFTWSPNRSWKQRLFVDKYWIKKEVGNNSVETSPAIWIWSSLLCFSSASHFSEDPCILLEVHMCLSGLPYAQLCTDLQIEAVAGFWCPTDKIKYILAESCIIHLDHMRKAANFTLKCRAKAWEFCSGVKSPHLVPRHRLKSILRLRQGNSIHVHTGHAWIPGLITDVYIITLVK